MFVVLLSLSNASADLLGIRTRIISIRWHYGFFVALLVLSVAVPLLPKKVLVVEPLNRANLEIAKFASTKISSSANASVADNSIESPKTLLNKDTIILSFLSLILVALLVRDFLQIHRRLRLTTPIRRIGRTCIRVSESQCSPFSIKWWRSTVVVIPAWVLLEPKKMKCILRHEFEHHRLGDTSVSWGFWFLAKLNFLNPFLKIWLGWISALQERRIDRVLIENQKVNREDYISCLFRAAQIENSRFEVPVCAAGFFKSKSSHELRRRIESMLNQNEKSKSWASALVAGFLGLMIGVTCYAARGLTREVSDEKIEKMVAKARLNSEFPIVVNADVARWIEYYVSSSSGREKFRLAMERKRSYDSLLNRKRQVYGIPEELEAVPIVESWYENLEAKNNKYLAAGLWQFIESTAINYGLKVNEEVDERMIAEPATDAAFRYLLANFSRFRDWQLALLAYNAGESQVQKAINRTRSYNAWTLLKSGLKTDKDYLPRVMAAIIVMKNPEVL